MKWRLADSLAQLRAQVNDRWPKRSTASDGSIGDAAHASRSSDHNPHISEGGGKPNVVSAIDITHDPRAGLDSHVLAQALLASRDERIKYIISNGKIAAGPDGPQPWVWRSYSGSNPHNHHVHISVRASKAHYDSVAPWRFDGIADAKPNPDAPEPPPTLRRGHTGKAVVKLQALLGVKTDGAFGPLTEAALKQFQRDNGLIADGICGPYSWEKLTAARRPRAT